jgi:hypothetical protein
MTFFNAAKLIPWNDVRGEEDVGGVRLSCEKRTPQDDNVEPDDGYANAVRGLVSKCEKQIPRPKPRAS